MKHRSLLVLAVIIFGFSISVNALTRYARIVTENANLRDTPSVASGTEQEIAEGSFVKVLDEKLPWYVVRFGNRVGWMHGNTIEFLQPQGLLPEAPRPQTVAPEYRPSAPAVLRRESPTEAPNCKKNADRRESAVA